MFEVDGLERIIDRRSRRPATYLLLICAFFLPALSELPIAPEGIPKAIYSVLSAPFIFAWPPFFVAMKVWTMSLVAAALNGRNAARRLFASGFALQFLGIAVFQNLSRTEEFGLTFLLGNFVIQSPLVALLAIEAMRPSLDLSRVAVGPLELAMLALAAAAFIFPVSEGAFDLADPRLWWGSESMATFCMALPVFLALLSCFPGAKRSALRRIGGFVGTLFGLVNLAGVADPRMRVVALFHIPLLAVSLAAFIGSIRSGPRKPGSALVTGASAGIGRAIAAGLAKMGYGLVISGRSAEALKGAAEEIRLQSGVAVDWIAADLGAPGAATRLFEEAERLRGDIEVLVNGAGFNHAGDFLETELSAELGMLQAHCASVAELAKAFSKRIAGRGYGYILNVASTAALMPLGLDAVYGATKAFTLSFSRGIAQDLRSRGIDVCAVCPGVTRTEFFRKAGIEDIRLRRLPSQSPEAVAKAALSGLFAGRAVVVPGLFNKALAFSLRLLPWGLIDALGRYYMAKPRRRSHRRAAQAS